MRKMEKERDYPPLWPGAVLQAALHSRSGGGRGGIYREVALNAAADWLALPRTWGLTQPTGAVGGAARE